MAETLVPFEQPPVGRDATAEFADWFARHADRLLALVRLRTDRRTQGRFDPADVLQETFLEASRRLPELADRPDIAPFVWLRSLALQQLMIFHRRHLSVKGRDARREIEIGIAVQEPASSDQLAAWLVGHLTTPSRAAMRREAQKRVGEALDALNASEREILELRHFEQLSNKEIAEVLGLRESTASMRYARALVRLKDCLGSALVALDSRER